MAETGGESSRAVSDVIPTIEARPEFKASPIRWYILIVHALVGIGQCLVYSTWGAIANSAEKGFHFSQTDFALLPNWFNIMYLFVIWPYMWMIQNIDLRSAELLTASLAALGATVRCLDFGFQYYSINRFVIHIGHAINGAAGAIPWMGCPIISALWFPPSERALATSLGVVASAVGAALSAMIGPMYVHSMAPSEDPTDEELRNAIRSLMYLEAAFCQLMLLIVIVYFPARPKYLPSFTAGQKRTPFVEGLREFSGDLQNWIMLCVYSVSSAIFVSWQQLLTIFVRQANMEEIEAGWLSFTVQILGICAGPTLSATSGLWIEKCPKLVSFIFMAIGSSCVTLVALSAFVFKPLFTRELIWAALIGAGASITACQPIWWEMACDSAYPVAEGIVSGTFSLGNCVVSCIFLGMYMFDQLGKDWATWTLAVCELICLPGIVIYRPSNKRTQCDRMAAEQAALSNGDLEIGTMSPADIEIIDTTLPKDIIYTTEL